MRVNNTWSDPLPVYGGVPQGSILGVLLCNVSTDDLQDQEEDSRILLDYTGGPISPEAIPPDPGGDSRLLHPPGDQSDYPLNPHTPEFEPEAQSYLHRGDEEDARHLLHSTGDQSDDHTLNPHAPEFVPGDQSYGISAPAINITDHLLFALQEGNRENNATQPNLDYGAGLGELEEAWSSWGGQVHDQWGLDMQYGGQVTREDEDEHDKIPSCLLYTSPSPRDRQKSRMPSSA